MPIVTESMVEDAALDWFRALGYHVDSGPDMTPGPDSLRYPLRESHEDVVLTSARARFTAPAQFRNFLRRRSTMHCAG